MFKSLACAGRRTRRLRSAALLAALPGMLAITFPVQAAAQASPAASATSTAPQWIPGRLLVQPRPGLSDQEFAKILTQHGGKSVGRIAAINVHIVQLPPNASEKVVAALLAKNPHIKFAEPDMLVKHGGTANDPYFGNEWHLSKIAAPTAWDSSTGSGVVIAILDSGVNGNLPDLQGQMVAGWNFYDNNSDTSDVHGHGTAVAGTAAAATNNGTGVASVAGGAKIMPVRIADANAYAYWSTVAQGLSWAADHGARVANISYVGVAGSSTVESAAQYMQNKGGLVAVCAGNNGIQESIASTSTMIPVSATDSNDALTSWSSYGNFVDLAAPGSGIWTTSRDGSYQQWSGTSFSSPIVAGTVGLMMAANPALGPSELQKRLLASTKDLGSAGWDMYYGYGRVDSAAAVLAAKGSATVDTTAPTVAITGPGSGTTVSGLVAVNVNATDNVGVSRVDLLVNGSKLASDTTSPYGFSWDSTKVSNGTATLVAYAYDAAGNYSSSSVNVTVGNTTTGTTDTTPPSVSIGNPPAGSTVKGNVTVQAGATDNVGVTSLTLSIDGQQVSTVNGSSLSYSWRTQRISAGTHTLTVDAKDSAGNAGTKSIQVVK